ncbi:hypothetical protein [Streptomyces sp. enrichment culture]|uniref:hypothetical protein n=1 Tax=Streptomyces sp. enrichment culture TaxID=1795815 RepID=UPI003F555365
MEPTAALVAAVTAGITATACRSLLAAAHPASAAPLARIGATRRPLPPRGWSGPGRGRRRWPQQLHPGSGPRRRPRL